MKKIISLFVVTLLLASIVLTPAINSGDSYASNVSEVASLSKDASEISININGQNIVFTELSGEPFVDESNRTQVPFRVALEAFGADVSWNDATRTAIAEKDGIKVEASIGQNYILKNGVKIQNDTAALIKDGRTYLPIRAVMEAFSADVSWNQDTQTVVIVSESGQTLTVHFIDIGQGDAIFVNYAEFEMLIDGGNRKDGKEIANYIAPYVDGAIELVIATHMDTDHFAGLIDLIPMFDIDKILYNGSKKDNTTCKTFHSVANAKQNSEYAVAVDQTIRVDDALSIKIITPAKQYSDENENSIVVELTHNDVKILLTGDMEKSSERDLLNRFSKVNILKASHHGSRTSSTSAFLNVVRPEVVIISAGAGNTYGHPHFEALQRFSNIGATVYGTFRDGTIVVNSDGRTYSIDAKTPLTLNDAGDKKEDTTTTLNNNNNSQNQQNFEIKYVGNTSSKKFHFPDCRSVAQISEKNIIYFYNISDTKGYDPCGTCLAQ